MKKALTFQNGRFTILTLADIHGGPQCSDQLKPAIEAMLEAVKPDLVVLGGDNAGLHTVHVENEGDLRLLLDTVIGPAEERGIPWVHVFGNHDDNYGFAKEEQQKIYRSYRLNLVPPDPEGVDGVSNFVLPVLGKDGIPAFMLWGLDSHRNNKDWLKTCSLPQDTLLVPPNHFNYGHDYDMPHFNQVVWYYQSSKEIEKIRGHKVPGMLFMHVALPEMYLVETNPEECQRVGNQRETCGCGEINTGLFAAARERGDITRMAFAHDHINDYTGIYCGISLDYMSSLNYDCYQHDDLRGAAVYEISEDDPWHPQRKVIYLRSLMGGRADRRGPSRGTGEYIKSIQKGSKTMLRIMSSNIWGDYFGNPVEERQDLLERVYKRYNPDILALQEATPAWNDSKLFLNLKEDYSFVPTPEKDNNYVPLLYKTDRFVLLEGGYVDYSDTPDPSKGITWGVFSDRETGKKLGVLCSHFWWQKFGDPYEDAIRSSNARVLSQKAREIEKNCDCPVVALGDFNSTWGVPSILTLKKEGWLFAREESNETSTVSTEHGDPKRGEDGRYRGRRTTDGWKKSIDHIIHRGNMIPTRFMVVEDQDALDATDHSPIFCDYDL